jgi:flagellar biogenesis protein FliO
LIARFIYILLFIAIVSSNAFAAQKNVNGPLPSFFQNDSTPSIKFGVSNPKDIYILNTGDNQTKTVSSSEEKAISTDKIPKAANNTNSNSLESIQYVQNSSPQHHQIDKISSNDNTNINSPETTKTNKAIESNAPQNQTDPSKDNSLGLATDGSQNKPNSATPDIMGYLIRFSIFLILLVLIPMLIIRRLKGKLNVSYSIPKSSNGFVRVVDNVTLSYSELFIVEVMDKYLLLSVSKDGNIKLIREFETIGIFPEKDIKEKKLEKSSFLDVLRRLKKEVKQLNNN